MVDNAIETPCNLPGIRPTVSTREELESRYQANPIPKVSNLFKDVKVRSFSSSLKPGLVYLTNELLAGLFLAGTQATIPGVLF